MAASSDLLIRKLDEFINKYYKNLLLKGLIYSTGILLSAFLLVVLLEYVGEFNTIVRACLFFGFVAAAVYVLVRFVITPLLKLKRIGKTIDHATAARIIGTHFSDVQDKLLNLLQLRNNQALVGSSDLLMAGIDQKMAELGPVPFQSAVDFRGNRKYLPYVLPVVVVVAAVAMIWPHVITKSTRRIVNFDTFYEREMPFSFQLTSGDLSARQTENYQLNVTVNGREIPNDVYIRINNIDYRMDKNSRTAFSYLFNNVQSTVQFQFSAAGYLSTPYTLKVMPRASLVKFSMKLKYPGYLHMQDQVIENSGDIQVPQGTHVTWDFNTRNSEQLILALGDTVIHARRDNNDHYSAGHRLMQGGAYSIIARNNSVGDSVTYGINVMADQYPVITMEQNRDSLHPAEIYFSGQIRDDHGFQQLQFHRIKTVTDSTGTPVTTAEVFPLSISHTNIAQSYYYSMNVAQLQLLPGDKVEYFFQVTDNDGVNGPKSARTPVQVFRAPTRAELDQATDKNNEQIRKDIEESISQSRQIQKEINDLMKKVSDKSQLGYEEKKKLEDLMKKQQQLQNKLEKTKQENQANQQQQNQFTPNDEAMLEKQKQLEQLFDNVMTPEMKKLFDEMNKLMEKMDKNLLQEKLDELKLTNKDIEKELDRNLELFKQLELEQKMQNAVEKLDDLKNQQQQLSEKTENKKNDSKSENQEKKADVKDLQEKQKDLNEKFQELKKDLEEIQEKNKALEEPQPMPNTEQLQKDVEQLMQKSSDQLTKNNRKNAAQTQKEAADKMDQMEQEMENSMQDSEEQQQEENAQALRQILENLLHVSFEQESLMNRLSETRPDNPKYVDIPKAQNKLRDDSKIIEDSLLALSKREPKISALVNRSINAINSNMEKTVKLLANRSSEESRGKMQSTMTAVNELALLLNESLEAMQNQMKNQQSAKKNGKCKKPGKGSGQNPSSKGNQSMNMRKMQEQINQQLQQMKEAMEKGQKLGDKNGNNPGKKPGDKQNQGLGMSRQQMGQGMPGSEEFAKMAAQQEALRRQMEELMSKLKNKGKNPGGDITQMMEETEKDLVNKQITNETMRRQQEILSKLLESEKAERERELDEQRKSNEAKSQNTSNPGQFLEYKRQKEKEMELLNTVPPSLTPFYKQKVNNYFNGLNDDSN